MVTKILSILMFLGVFLTLLTLFSTRFNLFVAKLMELTRFDFLNYFLPLRPGVWESKPIFIVRDFTGVPRRNTAVKPTSLDVIGYEQRAGFTHPVPIEGVRLSVNGWNIHLRRPE